MMKARKKAALFLCAFIFHLCNAVDLRCSVKRNRTLMVYTVEVQSYASDFQSVRCDYSWSNETTVLATDLEKHAAVLTKSLHTLETSDCHTHIFWMLQCWSKGTGLIDYAANCSTTCADLLQGGKPKDGESNIWIKAAIGTSVLLGLVGLIFLLYKFKERICRTLSSVRRLYTPVPKENNPEHLNALEGEKKADALAVSVVKKPPPQTAFACCV
ncbi:hypothetical protein ILYODFUR_027716 [Ilyodon furcidens]|uniref:Transmembrane protein n=1 Tax=Ilyodon furcidens TaxID=33524 RepID=A0ABV0UW32_9TELE